jgi:acetoin utilization deacetylase AcuC-like enzyme
MAKLAYIEHPLFLEHHPGRFHPESPERLKAIREYLSQTGFLEKATIIQPEMITKNDLLLVHSKAYIEFVLAQRYKENAILDTGDTVLSYHSVDAALFAAGSAKTALNMMFNEHYDKVFVAARPPGHHAKFNKGMGFCVFNNIAIAATLAKRYDPSAKILILDFDIHHGNGTQDIFYKDADIVYASLHRHPFYPGTGKANENGEASGEGYTLNYPINVGAGDDVFVLAVERLLLKVESLTSPDIILISAGFDGHKEDPLGGTHFTDEGYYKVTELIARFAQKHANGRIISYLEGGYDHNALARSVYHHLRCLVKH